MEIELNKDLIKDYSYDPESGVISRNIDIGNTKKGPCLSKNKMGYRRLTIDEQIYYQHRLVFVFMGVDIPKGMSIDHINGIKDDNRWVNLRIVTATENGCNQKIHRNGKERYITYQKSQKVFRVSKNVEGATVTFGPHKTLEAALEQRDWLIDNNWPLPAKKDKSMANISPRGEVYRVYKTIKGKHKEFGTCHSLEQAIERRDTLIANDWNPV